MKSKSRTSLALALVWLGGFSCQHQGHESPAKLSPMATAIPELARPQAGSEADKLQGWLYYTSLLAKMNAKDLRIEAEQLRRSLSREASWEDGLRLGLVQTAQSLHSRSYQRALESFEPLLQNKDYSPELQLRLAQYHEQLQQSAQLEKELGEERRERGELEAKLKALSKIELEMSQREKLDSVR